jgi:hypothetical protein
MMGPPGNVDEVPEDRSIRAIVDYTFENRVRAAADRALPTGLIRVWGEVLEVRESQSRRYLTLLDSERDDAWIDASVPRSAPVPTVGDRVTVDGRLRLDTRRNMTIRLELVGEDLKPRGDKAGRYDRWRKHFEAVRNGTEGASISKPIKRIALVTGETSAAIGDIRSRVGRPDGIEFPIEPFFAPMNEVGAIAAQIRRAADVTTADALVIARGGGHVAELHLFNHPDVISAIGHARAKLPVLTAIGHAYNELWVDQLAAKHFPVPAAVGHWLAGPENRGTWPLRGPTRAPAEQPPVDRPAAASVPVQGRWRRVREVVIRVLVGVVLVVAGWLARAVYDWWTGPGSAEAAPGKAEPRGPTDERGGNVPDESPSTTGHRHRSRHAQ